MATKSAITTEIQSKLSGNAGLTTHADHEDILFDDSDSILNELYKTSSVTDTHSSTNVFTTAGGNRNYSLYIKKQGGLVHVTGTLTNSGGSGIAASNWMSITNSEYDIGVGAPQYITGRSVYGDTINISLSITGDLFVSDTVAPLESINVNFSYQIGQ